MPPPDASNSALALSTEAQADARAVTEGVGSPRLVLVANRLPVQATRVDGKITFTESDGGLVSAVKSYFESAKEARYSEVLWVGAADFPEKTWKQFSVSGNGASAYTVVPIFVEKKTFDRYYNGFSNATIWPLFHYFLSFTEFQKSDFEKYEEVNRAFCARILELVQPGDTIWVHDYHLMLLPGMLRDAMPDATIGFFLHIPFPSFEMFRLLHREWKEKILQGLLGADLIGFQTSEYLQHFLKTTSMVLGLDHRYREVSNQDRLVRAGLFPIGIDFEKFNAANSNPEVIDNLHAIRERFAGLRIIFSVDRLDYTKGVTHRLKGFEKFLELCPEWQGKVVFILIVVPSRQVVSKYSERRKMIEEQISRINGQFSTLEWQPIIYRYSHVAFAELCAMYQSADVALITPLRDGMNLVAKEYIASRASGDGVLILSELAGAASELGEAMLVNPTDNGDVAIKLNAALTSTLDEQRENMQPMRDRVSESNVHTWVKSYFEELADIKQRQRELGIRLIDKRIASEIKHAFQRATRRLLFLDYDGTLVPIEAVPEQAAPKGALLSLLDELSGMPSTEVVIISGRNYLTLEKWLGHLSIHLVAEHGAAFRLKGASWQHFTDIDPSWKSIIQSTFEHYASRSPGAFVEMKDYTIAWHYRGVDPALGFVRSRELLDNLYHLIRNTHLNVLDGHKVIEVRAAGIDKGIATGKLMEMFPSDFIFAMGDDKTDEDIFRIIRGNGATVKVGSELTHAQFNVASQAEAFELLHNLKVGL
jgi:trehalose 6-phosphate synthase/phosphatase